MKNKKEKILKILVIILVVIILLVTIIYLIFSNKTKDNKIVTSEIQDNNQVNDVYYDVFKITNMTYEVDEINKNTKIFLTIKNSSDEVKFLNSFDIIIKDRKGNKIEKLFVYIDREFAKDEEYELVAGIDLVIDDASILEFNFK